MLMANNLTVTLTKVKKYSENTQVSKKEIDGSHSVRRL